MMIIVYSFMFGILNIVETQRRDSVYLFCQRLEKIEYESHFRAQHVLDTSKLKEFYIIKIIDVIGPPLSITNTANGKKMILVKEYYSYRDTGNF